LNPTRTIPAPKPKPAAPAKQPAGAALQKPGATTTVLPRPAPRLSFLNKAAGQPVKKETRSSWAFTGNQKRNDQKGKENIPAPAQAAAIEANPAARQQVAQRLMPPVQPLPAPTKPAAKAAPKTVAPEPKQAPKKTALKKAPKKQVAPKKDKQQKQAPKKLDIKPVNKTKTNNQDNKTKQPSPRVKPPVTHPVTTVQAKTPATAKRATPPLNIDPAKKISPAQSEKRSSDLMKNELKEAERGGRSEVRFVPGQATVVKPNTSAKAAARAADKPVSINRPVAATAPTPARATRSPKPVKAPKAKKITAKKTAAKKMPAQDKKTEVPKTEPFNIEQHVAKRSLSMPEVSQVIQRGEHLTGRAQVQQRLARGNSIATQAKGRVRSTATQKKTAITTQKQTITQQIGTQATQYEEASAEFFDQKINDLRSNQEEKLNTLQTEQERTVQQHQTTTTQNKESGHNSLQEKKTAFRNHVNAEKAELTRLANAEADRCDGELEAAAVQALREGESIAGNYRGSEDPLPEQRQAARHVGMESANDIRNKKEPTRTDLLGRVTAVAAQYDEFLTDIQNKITDAQTQLQQTVDEIGNNSVQELGQKFEQARHTFGEKTSSGITSLQQKKESDRSAANTLKEQKTTAVETLATEALRNVDTAATQAVNRIDASNGQTGQQLSNPSPYVPGAMEMMQHNEQSVQNIAQGAVTALQGFENGFRTGSGTHATQLSTTYTGMQAQSRTRGNGTTENTKTSISQVMEALQSDCRLHEQGMTEKQTGYVNDLQSEVDKAITAATEKIAGFKNDFITQLRQAGNEALVEAKKPLYDPTETRANEAAIRAGESALMGFLRAVADIAFGLLIFIAVALLVAAIAAAFGILLTAWTAIMIAGVLLLAFGLVMALRHRYLQARDGDHGEHSYAIMFWALGDVTGVTMIIEAVYGHDVVTGQALSTGEAVYRGTLGLFTAVMLVFGARSAAKGPPGGLFTRPGGIRLEFPAGGWRGVFQGLRNVRARYGELYAGVRESFAGWNRLWAVGRSIGATFVDIVTGILQQGRQVRDAIGRLLGERQPTRPVEADAVLGRANTPSAEVGPENLRTSEPVYQEGGEGQLSQYTWQLIADVPAIPATPTTPATPARSVVVSEQYVYTRGPNNPVSGPEQFLRPAQGVGPGGEITPVRLREPYKWTTESLRMAMEAFRRRFGFTPRNLSGELAEANLGNFQFEYNAARANNPGGSPQSWADVAIRQISFGGQRVGMQFDNITVRISGSVEATYTPKGKQPVVLRDVPNHVEVDAHSLPQAPYTPPPQPGEDSTGESN
jgi:hypothetical protein